MTVRPGRFHARRRFGQGQNVRAAIAVAGFGGGHRLQGQKECHLYALSATEHLAR